jgi:hypothetical protein
MELIILVAAAVVAALMVRIKVAITAGQVSLSFHT